MKTGEDFRKAFPDMDAGFENAAHRALAALPKGKENRSMKYKPLIAFALLAVVLLMGVGVAATWERWSLNDFIPSGRITATQDQWQQMVEAFQPVTVEGDMMKVTVREALYDGFALYMVVDMQPRNAGMFLVSNLVELDDIAGDVVAGFPEDVTLEEHVTALGYTEIGRLDVSPGLPSTNFPPEMALNEDGTFTCYLRLRLRDGQPHASDLEMTLSIMVQGSDLKRHYMGVPLTIPTQPVLEMVQSPAGEGHTFANSGMRLSNVTLYRTMLSTYVTADVEITDQAAFDAHYQRYLFNFFDAAGQEIDVGPFNLSGVTQTYERGQPTGEWRFTTTLTLSELPDTLTLAESIWGARDMQGVTDAWDICLEKVE